MNLQGRNLSIEMQGDEVQLLQSELRQLRFALEEEERIFNQANRSAVLIFQPRNALEGSGELEKQRVKLITPEVDALKSTLEPDEEPQGFVIHKQIVHQEWITGLVPLQRGLGKGGRTRAQPSRNHPLRLPQRRNHKGGTR